MPIFEYVCKKCQHRFEIITHGSTDVACPSCQSVKLEKQLSVFAANSKGSNFVNSSASVGGCGTCGDPRGPGSCSMN